MNKADEGIRAVRDVRVKISSEFANDPERLVKHYIEQQERYRDRLLPPLGGRRDAADAFPDAEAIQRSGVA